MHNVRKLHLLILPALAAAVLLGGCRTEGQRIGVTDTTRAHMASAEVLPTALIEFSSQAPQRLTADLRELPIIQELERPATIIVGDINNQTQIVSSSEFEMAMSRFRNNLINSRIARTELQFVAPRARMGRIADREGVATGEGLPAGPEAYDQASTFALNGDFYRINRGPANLYYMELQLVHFGTNHIVWSDRYEIQQVRGDR